MLIALRLGAFQLLHMDRIPARAAIDESVELAKHAGHRFASGMVNAVLRKLGSSSLQLSEQSPAELALAQAHPVWMVERWAGFYGLEAARDHLPARPEPAGATIACAVGPTRRPNLPRAVSFLNRGNC